MNNINLNIVDLNGGRGKGLDIIDNLDSTRTDAALSANMGRVLGQVVKITEPLTSGQFITGTLSEMAETLGMSEADVSLILDASVKYVDYAYDPINDYDKARMQIFSQPGVQGSGYIALVPMNNRYAIYTLRLNFSPRTQTVNGLIFEIEYINFENASNKVTSISSLSTNVQYPSAKAVYDAINPESQSSMPAGGFKHKVPYDLGVIGDTSFLLADGIAGKQYMWTFETGSTAPSITWPTGIQWPKDFEPAINASTHYEVNIRNGYAYLGEFEIL